MRMELITVERCEICGAECRESRTFCHFYTDGRKINLCGSMCAERYLHGPDQRRAGDTQRDFLNELAEERRWSLWCS
jgi:hypothetical protein